MWTACAAFALAACQATPAAERGATSDEAKSQRELLELRQELGGGRFVDRFAVQYSEAPGPGPSFFEDVRRISHRRVRPWSDDERALVQRFLRATQDLDGPWTLADSDLLRLASQRLEVEPDEPLRKLVDGIALRGGFGLTPDERMRLAAWLGPAPR